jgi:hypothetical protein
MKIDGPPLNSGFNGKAAHSSNSPAFRFAPYPKSLMPALDPQGPGPFLPTHGGSIDKGEGRRKGAGCSNWKSGLDFWGDGENRPAWRNLKFTSKPKHPENPSILEVPPKGRGLNGKEKKKNGGGRWG